jgi:hypothetical protein
MELIDYAKNVYTQNGEDGIIERVFQIIGTTNKLCCEFGAWDGIHFSNTRSLILSGWEGYLIEGDGEKFIELMGNYSNNPKVTGICAWVDETENNLQSIFRKYGLTEDLDFLSSDIDGLDYYVFENLAIRPRLVCIEINAGHYPEANKLIPRNVARNNVGQPLGAFCEVADQLGYRLICYTGNAFFLRSDVGYYDELPTLSPTEAYMQFLNHLPLSGKEWLGLVNKGLAPPFFCFKNPYLSARALNLSGLDLLRLLGKGLIWKARGLLKKVISV